MENIEALVKLYNTKYFDGALKNLKVVRYRRKSRTFGWFLPVSFSIHINTLMRTSEVELKETILHEMTHAYLFATERPWKHSPQFKARMRFIVKQEFGIVPQGNPRFSMRLDEQLAAQKKPVEPVPNFFKTLYKVKSNGMIGEMLRESIAYGRKMVTLKVEGALFPFTTELTNVEVLR